MEHQILETRVGVLSYVQGGRAATIQRLAFGDPRE